MTPHLLPIALLLLSSALPVQGTVGALRGTKVDRGSASALSYKKVSALLTHIDDFFTNQDKVHGILQTYGTIPDPKQRHDVYDSALAAIYFVERGSLTSAKQMLDTMTAGLYNSSHALAGQKIPVTTKLPSGVPPETFRLLVNSVGDCDCVDWASDMGNNAFVGLAFSKYAAATGDSCYALVARDILTAIDASRGCPSSPWKGWKRRLPPMKDHDTRSTEHAIDIGALAQMLEDSQQRSDASIFVARMFNASNPRYVIGTATDGDILSPEWQVITDTTVWNVAADADYAHPEHMAEALKNVIKFNDWTDNGSYGYDYHGVRFSSGGEGIQWEVTASTVVAFDGFMSRHPKYVDDELRDMYASNVSLYRASVEQMIQEYGYMMACIHPNGCWRGVDPPYPYPVKASVAATAWAGLMLLKSNPYITEGVPSFSTAALECIRQYSS
eukprot:TRINITY_DN11440_c0_g1_i1.p1 TRINITY_DN11440_c0_g1~~TRINITY_DN11440_c0_g1_i1.p1  ORF type:complete len:443 (+),score=75.13 TRINITY_DN11440_c0_g1_i1:83-1411(+)